MNAMMKALKDAGVGVQEELKGVNSLADFRMPFSTFHAKQRMDILGDAWAVETADRIIRHSSKLDDDLLKEMHMFEIQNKAVWSLLKDHKDKLRVLPQNKYVSKEHGIIGKHSDMLASFEASVHEYTVGDVHGVLSYVLVYNPFCKLWSVDVFDSGAVGATPANNRFEMGDREVILNAISHRKIFEHSAYIYVEVDMRHDIRLSNPDYKDKDGFHPKKTYIYPPEAINDSFEKKSGQFDNWFNNGGYFIDNHFYFASIDKNGKKYLSLYHGFSKKKENDTKKGGENK